MAAEHRVAPLNEKAPADGVPKAIAAQLADKGLRVIRGEKTHVCDIWLCRELPVGRPSKKADIVYPFRQGQLIGVVRYARTSRDFKNQKIRKGVYTMRFAYQPTDGNHIGTFATKDFLLLVSVADDTKVAPPKLATLIENSVIAAQSAHPAFLCLLKSKAKKTPVFRHLDETDWWILQLTGNAKRDGKPVKLLMDLVIAGYVEE